MDIEMKQKLEENQKKLKHTAIADLKKRIIENTEHSYRFTDDAESEKLKHFIQKLEFISPAHLSTERCSSSISQHDHMYLCFLCGSEELLDIFLYGSYQDILSDLDNWDLFSPYLLLIDEDFIRYIYINDNGEMYESEICNKEKVIAIEDETLGILNGRDCIFIDTVTQDDMDNLIIKGEINGHFAEKIRADKWIPFSLIFHRVIAYFSCELDTYENIDTYHHVNYSDFRACLHKRNVV